MVANGPKYPLPVILISASKAPACLKKCSIEAGEVISNVISPLFEPAFITSCSFAKAFVRAAAIELTNNVRINTISPGVVEDSPGFFPYFRGHIPVTMERVTQAYIKSALGALTGQVIKVF